MNYLHTMIRVTDLEAALRFFCEGLELKEVSRNDYPQGQFTLVFLAAPEDYEHALSHKRPCLELTYNWPKDGVAEQYTGGRNFGHLAFAVDDIYQVCERLQDMGVSILRPPRDGRMAFVRSPDQISIELLQKGGARPAQEPWLSMPNTGTW